jgi:lysyl-tRNA synthetase class II
VVVPLPVEPVEVGTIFAWPKAAGANARTDAIPSRAMDIEWNLRINHRFPATAGGDRAA